MPEQKEKPSLPGFMPGSRPWIIAHRGARKEAPENTRSAFERALAYPIDGIELDVQMSADNVPVICHDPTLYRIVRQRRRISNRTFDDLAALDWGGWFDSRFSGEPLMTLDQVLLMPGRRTRLFIEIKADPFEQRSGHSYALAHIVSSMLADPAYGLSKERVHVLSFDPEVLRIVHGQVPHYRLVLNVLKTDCKDLVALPAKATTHLWAVDVDIAGLTPAVAAWARDRGLCLFTYTCNTPAQLTRALALKVDGVISDRPGWLTGVFTNR